MTIKTTALALIALAATALPAHANQERDAVQCVATTSAAILVENNAENIEELILTSLNFLDDLDDGPATEEIRETGYTIIYEFQNFADLYGYRNPRNFANERYTQ